MPSSRQDSPPGKASAAPFSRMLSGVRPFWTMKMARSPTILEDGVTLMMSPSMSFTDLYISLTSLKRLPRPRASTWGWRLVYCPPGIS